jgi:hypothetical protein
LGFTAAYTRAQQAGTVVTSRNWMSYTSLGSG